MTIVLNNNISDVKRSLELAFEKGFSSAAVSLGRLVSDKVVYHNLQNEDCVFDDINPKDEVYRQHDKSKDILVMNEISGEFAGKSYLFLSTDEFDQLTIDIPKSPDKLVNYKVEFIKELNNNISEIVVTELSKSLQKKMYMDMAVMVAGVGPNIKDAIYNNFIETSNRVYINSISFSLVSNSTITPLFIWVLDLKG